MGEDALTIVAEGRMADVVPQGDGLQKIFVETEIAADGAGDFGEELDVQDPVADVFVFYEIEHLGLVDVAGIGPGMEDAVGVHRKVLAVAFPDTLFETAPNGLGAPGGIGGEAGFFLPLELLA